MSENEEEEKEEHPQSSDFPMTGYEAAEEERRSLENEEHNAHVTSLKEEPSPALAKQQKRDEKRGKQRRSAATDISMAASAWQVTLFDLDEQLNRQRALMERMADDIKHLRKQFNQVQRDLAKFQKRMEKIRTTPLSTAKRGKRRG